MAHGIIQTVFFLGFGSILIIGTLIYSQNRAGYLNKLFLWCTAAAAYRTLCEWGIRFSGSHEEAVAWANVSFLRPVSMALFVHFILYFTGYWQKVKWYVSYTATYLPAALFSTMFLLRYDKYTGLIKTEYGWVFQNYFPSLIFKLNLIWAISIGAIFLIAWWAYFFRCNPVEKKKKLVFSHILTILILASIALGVLKAYHVVTLFPLNGLVVLWLFIVTGYLILKYKIILAPSQIMEEIILTMDEGLILLSNEAEILKVNKAISTLSGYRENELIGKSAGLLLPSDMLPVLLPLCVPGKTYTLKRYESALTTKSNSIIPVELSATVIPDKSGVPLASVILCKDLARIRKIEAGLQKAQKLDTYELMAQGIMHDFNNLLNIISMRISLSGTDESLSPTIKNDLITVTNATKLASTLAAQFGQYFKESSSNKKKCNLAGIIDEAAAIAKCGKKFDITLENLSDLPAVEVNHQQLMQVFINLFINAGHAMNDRGTISVRGKTGPNGQEVIITVEDHGCGIKKEALPHVFEPFFTTKSNGHGLGLTIVAEIIKNHKGTIAISSTEGAGTLFTITLPIQVNFPEAPDGFSMTGKPSNAWN